ncbi:MAG TPA: T9SS type A sorting domain-containing protein [Draconibacterium sp.]|nr:T9SS type A sorting domain-containing protein [Draconibacterium sp.]
MKSNLLICFCFIATIAFSQQITEPYDYPVKPGDQQWAELNGLQEKTDVLQIPSDVLSKMSTEALVVTCLNYPLFSDIFAIENQLTGFEIVKKNFNGLTELAKRKDAGKCLMNIYESADISGFNLQNPGIDSKYSLIRVIWMDYILAQDELIATLSQKDRNELFLMAKERFNFLQQENQNSSYKKFSTVLLMVRVLQALDNPEYAENDGFKMLIDSSELSDRETMDLINEFINSYPGNLTGNLKSTSSSCDSWVTPRGTSIYGSCHDGCSISQADYQTMTSWEEDHDIEEWSQEDCHYNCHAFAWGWRGSGSTLPDASMDNSSAELYVTDGSYVEVPLQPQDLNYAEIVKYGDSHSAMVIEGELVSKWNLFGKVYVHTLTDVPLSFGTNYEFYISSPYITGSTTIDTSGTTFQLHNLINGVTIDEWEVSDSLEIVGSSTQTTCTVKAIGSGTAWIKANFTYHGATFSCKKKYVTAVVPEPEPPCDEPTPPGTIYEYTNCPYYYVQYWVTNVSGQTYTWYVQGDGTISSGQGSNMITVQTSGPGGYLYVSVRAENECTYGTFTGQGFETPDCYMMSLSPNPATDLLKIELNEEPSDEAIVNIHNSQSIKMMATTLSKLEKEKTIDISALKEGIYYVTLQMKNKRITGSFIKK